MKRYTKAEQKKINKAMLLLEGHDNCFCMSGRGSDVCESCGEARCADDDKLQRFDIPTRAIYHCLVTGEPMGWIKREYHQLYCKCYRAERPRAHGHAG